MATEVVNFLGFRQVSKSYFDALSSAEKKNHLWFVREVEGGETKHAEIYFGTRKYGELNDDEQESVKLNNLIAAMGSMVDEDGNWKGFPQLSITGNTLAEFLENIVEHFDSAISAETQEREAVVEELIEAINQESELRAEADEILSGAVVEVEGRVTTLEEEVEELKRLGILYFAGVASAVSGDTIILMDGTEIVASSANTGAVYMIEKKEYASNGETWIFLGDESEVTKLWEALAKEIASRQSEDSALNNKVAGLDTRIETLESDTTHIIMGDDLEEYSESEANEIVNNQLSNVAVNGGTALIQNDATLEEPVVVGE